MKAIIAKKTNKQIQKTWFSLVEIPLFFPWRTVRVQQINQNSSQIQSREDTM